ncbi:hypothetical protein RB195_005515 [Necator americanus]|uniref:Secreted protein n=1 Tax=Necator americanus TaxID=51031 RepID=A0ABR1BQ39_NECAM
MVSRVATNLQIFFLLLVQQATLSTKLLPFQKTVFLIFPDYCEVLLICLVPWRRSGAGEFRQRTFEYRQFVGVALLRRWRVDEGVGEYEQPARALFPQFQSVLTVYRSFV